MKFIIKSLTLFFLLFTLKACEQNRLDDFGLVESSPITDTEEVYKLRPCPEDSNCISSYGPTPDDQSLEPIELHSDINQAKRHFERIIKTTPRSQIIEQTENYIHAEFKSSIFGFIDDLELYFDEKENIVQFRSLSRQGLLNFGSYKKRIERLRFRYHQRDYH